MKNMLIVVLVWFTTAMFSHAATYYVALNGSNTNPGSESYPFLTIAKAVGIANPGDVIYVRGGTYSVTTTISISRSGTQDLRCTLSSYPGERALLNFSGQSFGQRGISLTASYWTIKGIDITKSGDNGIYISGAYNIIDFCSFFDNQDSGMQLSGGAHHNQIINCDSYWNADPTDYGDADGFACKMDVGTGNYFYGCRSWLNVDDGWDGYMRGADDVTTVLENCWTWKNGYFKDGSDAGVNANGNGFKVGGSDDKTLKHNFTLRNCVAFDNKAKGFDQNNNKGDMLFYNCTAYRNVGNNFSIPSAIATGKVAEVKNCASVDAKIGLASFVVQEKNSWLSPFVTTTADFASLDASQALNARQSDGSLPVIDFVHLAKGSDLIDGGVVLSGISYLGVAPDLGAFEYVPATGLNVAQVRPGNKIIDVWSNGSVLTATINLVATGSGNLVVYDLSGRVIQQLPFVGGEGSNHFVWTLNGSLNGVCLAMLDNNGLGAVKFSVNR